MLLPSPAGRELGRHVVQLTQAGDWPHRRALYPFCSFPRLGGVFGEPDAAASADRVEQLKREMRDGERPAGVPASGVVLYVRRR